MSTKYPTNPLHIVYEALWALFIKDAEFTSLFRPGNRVKLEEGDALEKEGKLTADYPEIGLFPAVSQQDRPPHIITSDCREWVHRISVRLRTGEQSTKRILDAQWLVYRIVMENRCTLPHSLLMNGDEFLIRISTSPSSLQRFEDDKGGWTDIIQIEVVMGIDRKE